MDSLPANGASDARDLDLAAPDALAASDARADLGPGDLYDPSEDPNASGDAAPLDAGVTAQPADPLGRSGASDDVLDGLTPDDDAFGPGSGALGDTNSPSDEL